MTSLPAREAAAQDSARRLHSIKPSPVVGVGVRVS